jgi:hypothetical protein
MCGTLNELSLSCTEVFHEVSQQIAKKQQKQTRWNKFQLQEIKAKYQLQI